MKPPLSFPTRTTLQNGAVLEAEQNGAFLEAVQIGALLEVQNGALLEAVQNGAHLKPVHSHQQGSLPFQNVMRLHGNMSM
jgi:hypothetical protein